MNFANLEEIILNHVAFYPGTTILRILENEDRLPKGLTPNNLREFVDKLIGERKIKVLKISYNSGTMAGTSLNLLFDVNTNISSFG